MFQLTSEGHPDSIRLSYGSPPSHLTVVLLLIVVAFAVALMTSDPVEALKDHDLIDIRGPSDITSENGVVSGDGSQANPYVIEGWSINASRMHAIYINNVHSYLVIRNVVLYYHYDPELPGSFGGIRANRISNLRIENVTVHDFPRGIDIDNGVGVEVVSTRCYGGGTCFVLETTSGLVVRDCIAEGGYKGIDLNRCKNAILINTTLVNNSRYGIYNMYNAGYHYVKVRGCNISGNQYGVYIEDSNGWTFSDCIMDNDYYNMELHTTGHTITNCTFGKTGISFMLNGRNWKYQTVDETNTVNGLPLLFLKNATDMVVDYPVGQAFLVNCENVTLRDQTIDGCLNAIGLVLSNNCTVVNNTVIDARWGISVGGWYCVGNRIIANTIRMDRLGLYTHLDRGISCWGRSFHIEGNEITGDGGYGMLLWPDDLQGRLTNYTLVDNRIKGPFEVGIYLYPDSWGTGIYFAGNFILRGDTIEGCEVGIQSHYWGGIVEDCTVIGCNQTGMLFEAMIRLTIRNCTLIDNADNVRLFACDDSIFVHNTIDGRGRSRGLASTPTTEFLNSTSTGAPSVISDNTIHNCTLGIEVDDAYYLTMERNVLRDIEGPAIDLNGCYKVSINNSSVLRCLTGLFIEHSTDITMCLNDIEGCSIGIRTIGSIRLDIHHNHVRLSEGYAVHISSAGHNKVFHNSFDRNNMKEGSSSYLGPQAKDDATGNIWDNSREGNWWSDYTIRYPNAKPLGRIWDTPYDLESDVTGGVVDRYPLTNIVDLEAPVAIAGGDITIKEGEDLRLDGSASSDNYGIVSFTWTVEGEADIWAYTGATITIESYEPGIYHATLNVTDAWGNWDIDTIKITVLEFIPTLADAGPDMELDHGQIAVLDGSGSIADGGVVNFTWSLVMGGVDQVQYGEVVKLECTHVGTYTVTLNVIGADGGRNDDTMTLTVRDVRAPIPVVDQVYSVPQFQTFIFDGSRSVDDVGIEVYEWYFVHNGEPIVLTGKTTEFSFDIAGTYIAALVVEDAAGNSASMEFQVLVSDAEPPDISPIDDKVVYIGEEVVLNHDGVTDNVEVTSFEWNIVFQGATTGLVGEEVVHVFDDIGLHTVTFMVGDAEGNLASLTFNISVRPHDAPIADAGPDQVIDEETICTLDGSGSRDKGQILEFIWTFNYDGEERTLNGKEATFKFDIPGTYEVTLTVTNSMNVTATDSLKIRVRDLTPPIAIAGGDVHIRPGSWADLDGSFSTDNVGIVNFTWEVQFDDGVVRHHGVETSIQFTNDGSYSVTLTVRDADGNIGTDVLKVTVSEEERSTSISPLLILIIILIVIGTVSWYVDRRRKSNVP